MRRGLLPILTTPRLALRELTPGDAPFILELVNEPAWIANIRDTGVTTLEAARGYIEVGPMASYTAHGFGLWAVEARETGECFGICGVLRRDGLDAPDLGFAFLARARGQGYATEAAAATLAHARDALRLPRVLAIVSPHNTASARVLKKIGMREEGEITLPTGKANRLWVWEA
ncbi:MAG TPA: GNAT family N-acetyltransferase [Caulobacteraceae bacterium]